MKKTQEKTINLTGALVSLLRQNIKDMTKLEKSEYDIVYYEKNKEKIRLRSLKYRLKNSEAIKKRKAEYFQKNKKVLQR